MLELDDGLDRGVLGRGFVLDRVAVGVVVVEAGGDATDAAGERDVERVAGLDVMAQADRAAGGDREEEEPQLALGRDLDVGVVGDAVGQREARRGGG